MKNLRICYINVSIRIANARLAPFFSLIYTYNWSIIYILSSKSWFEFIPSTLPSSTSPRTIEKMSIASIKKRCWKILFAILLVTNQLTISSNAHSAESPRFTQQQKPLQMENPANNSNERPKMIPPWLTKANKVMDGIKNRSK